MRYFTKITQDEHNEIVKWLLEKPLRLAVYYLCFTRARRDPQNHTNGLAVGEFFLSKTEYKIFGLRKTQAGKIGRIVSDLIFAKLVAKTDKRIGSEHSVVYRVTSNNVMSWVKETDTETDSEQTVNRQRIDTNIDNKRERKIETYMQNSTSLEKKQTSQTEHVGKLLNDKLTPAEIYDVAVTSRVWINDVVHKYISIREMVKTGEFTSRYPYVTSLKSTLARWLEYDISKHIISKIDPLYLLMLKDYDPSSSKHFYEYFIKYLPEMNYENNA